MYEPVEYAQSRCQMMQPWLHASDVAALHSNDDDDDAHCSSSQLPRECLDASDVPAHDQSVNVSCTLVRVDGLQVHHVPNDVILVHDAVACGYIKQGSGGGCGSVVQRSRHLQAYREPCGQYPVP